VKVEGRELMVCALYTSLLENIVDGIFNSIKNLQGRDQSTVENADEHKV
jgi:cytochrome b